MKKAYKRITSMVLAVMMIISLLPAATITAFAAGTFNLDVPLENLGAEYTGAGVEVENSPGTVEWVYGIDESSGEVYINGSAEGMFNSRLYFPERTTLTFTNNFDEEAVLSFNYNVELSKNIGSSDHSVTIDGNVMTGSGYFEKKIAAGEMVDIEIYVAMITSTKTNKSSVYLTNVRFGIDQDIETTFIAADPVTGSYTVSYGETEIDITEDTAIINKATTGYALEAFPAEGYSFAGWYSSKNGGTYISVQNPIDVRFDIPQNVEALFVKTENGAFGVEDSRFSSLDKAIEGAKTSADKIIFVANDCVLEGSHTIPAGMTLLVPFDEHNSLYKEVPGCTSSKNNNVAWVKPYPYRTLELAEGASLEIEGAVSLSAMHSAGAQQTAGSPSGAFGHIKMAKDSTIVVKNGASLYTWGYITGEGRVIAESGAAVYENLQITDFRGGNASASMLPQEGSDVRVFPFSQYYIRNIEVELTLFGGSKEVVYTSIYALDDVNSASIEFIGTESSMFHIEEGSYVVKDYDEKTDRLVLSADGNGKVAINGLTITLANIPISSDMFFLPITNNITINIKGGEATVNQDVAFLPGTEVIVDEGAVLRIRDGKEIFIYDTDEWNLGNFVHINVKLRQISYSPSGTNGTPTYRSASDLKDAKFDVNGTIEADGQIYTTAGGANITSSRGTGQIHFGTNAGTKTATYQVTQEGTLITFVTLPATSMKLKNTDGSYTETTDARKDSRYVWDKIMSRWTNKVSVYFDGNGGTGKNDPVGITYLDIYINEIIGVENTVVLPENGFVKNGWKFKEWNTSSDGLGTGYAEGASFPIETNTVLYAIWEADPQEMTITFKGNGASEEDYIQTILTHTESTLLPNVFTREGYKFLGWAESADSSEIIYGNEANVFFEYVQEIVLHAVWEKEIYDITWVVEGEIVKEDKSVEYGTVLVPPEAPSKPDDKGYSYEFMGWNTAEDGSGEFLAEGGIAKESVTYYAYFKANPTVFYTVVFKNGDEVLQTSTETYLNSVKFYGLAPSKEGSDTVVYKFFGWSRVDGSLEDMIDLETFKVEDNETFYAVFVEEPRPYFVYWDFDGDGKADVGNEVLYGAKLPDAPVPEKEGHTFIGWDDEIPATMPAGDLVFTAEWSVNSYTVTFDPNNGEETFSVTKEYGSTVEEPEEPSKEGYVFDGWFEGEKEVKLPATMPENGMNLKAKWVPAKYTVFFDSDGGSAIPSLTRDYKSKIDAPADPKKDGYSFIGWYNGEEKVEFPFEVPLGGAELKAKWSVNSYTITFDTNGGSDVAPITQEYNTAVTAPAAPTKTGYTFAGWDVEIPETMPAKDMTIKAAWTINQYTITFDTDGGSDVAPITQEYNTAVTAPAAPTRTGYTFAGWDAEIPAAMPAENVTIKAKWTPNKYTITFDTDGGSAVPAITADYGTAVTAPANPEKEGYTFDGWDQKIPATIPAENITIKALWKANNYTVTFESDGKVVGSVTKGYKTEVTAPADPVKTGYTFAGWFIDGEKVEFPMSMPLGGVTVSAGWTINKYTITFDTNGGSEVSAITADFGSTVSAPAEPEKADHVFAGWIIKDSLGRDVPVTFPIEMPAKDFTLYAVWVYDYTGWVTDDEGKTYFENGKLKYISEMASPENDGNYYYFGATGYIESGLVEIGENAYVFDEETGIRIEEGVAKDGKDLYFVSEGVVITETGLILYNNEYYYIRKNGKLAKDGIFLVTKTNGLLEEDKYIFDAEGVLIGKEQEEIPEEPKSKNGIFEEDGTLWYYRSDLKTGAGLILIGGKYYYTKTTGEVVTGSDYWVSRTNGLVSEGMYSFGADGAMLYEAKPDPEDEEAKAKTGIFEEDGKLFYYLNGEKTYAGLVLIDGEYYYVKADCTVVCGTDYWVSRTNGLVLQGKYTFDEHGAMTL